MGQYKKLSINVLVMTIGKFSSKALTFLLVPLYTSILSTAEYGVYDLLVTTVTLLTPLLTLTISEGVMRFCLDENYKPKDVLTIGLTIVLLGTGVLAAAYPIIKSINLIADYYAWILMFFAASNIHLIMTQFLKGVNKVKLYAICGIISTIVTLVLNILFLVVFKFGILGYMMAYIIGHLAVTIFICLKIKVWKLIANPFAIEKKVYKDLLAYSCPMIPNSICWWVSNSSDKYMVSGFLSTSMLGIYSVSYKIPNIMSIFTTIFNSAFQISAVDNFGDEKSKKFFGDIYQLFSSCNVIVASVLILFSEMLATILYKKAFFIAWQSSTILIMAFLFNSMSGILGTVYTSAKKTSMLFYSTIVAAVLNIVLNLVLIPRIGIIGAAIATLASYVCVWLIRLIHSRTILNFKVNFVQNILSYILMIIQILLLLSDVSFSFWVAALITVFILLFNMAYVMKSDLASNVLRKKFKKKTTV